ncbi:hypothetical protein HQ585_00605 [candidate division KSB1 bacterium]|nr:hypothetical protein [candidate division KSB1 bacterium]
MKRFIQTYMLILLLITNTHLIANEDSTKTNLLADYSIQFRISNNFTLNSFQGSIISLKKHFKQENAVRISIGFWGNYYDTDEDAWPYKSAPNKEHEDNINVIHDLDLNCLYLWYPKPNNKIKHYFGIGPKFGYRKTVANSYLDEYYNEKIMNHTANCCGSEHCGQDWT